MSAATLENSEVSVEEAIQLSAVDSLFYSRYFFPRTVRQASPPAHKRVWNALERPNQRFVNIQMHRDGAKTTLLRLFTSKRVAFNISRTILYIGKSEGHAVRSVDWIRKQIMMNSRFNTAFGLRKGNKFQGTEAEIYHSVYQEPIWILATGIWGSTRGINLDDWRPDLIVLDDVVADENAASEEGRKKLNEVIEGAVLPSLSPASESPHAKVVMLNTPQANGDFCMEAMKDPEWLTLRYGCWTPETEDLALEERKSSWEERYPSAVMREKKRAAIARGRGHVFNREYECRITSSDVQDLQRVWIQHYDTPPPREELEVVYVIDPVPPPSENAVAKGLAKKDYEAHVITARHGHKIYHLQSEKSKGHTPDWTIATFFHLLMRWKPRIVRVESVNYQRTLKWLLEKEMKLRGMYAVIDGFDDKRSKYDVILDALQPVGPQGLLHINCEQNPDLVESFSKYPDIQFDDELEAFARGVEWLSNRMANEVASTTYDGGDNVYNLWDRRSVCP